MLRQLIGGQAVSRLIYVAAKLGIADLLQEGPKRYEELAEATEADPQALYRVLRALASVGIFSETKTGLFAQNQMSRLLQAGAADSLLAIALLTWEPWWRQGWDELLYSVKTGEVAFDHVHGRRLFDFLRGDAQAASLFSRAMSSLTEQEITSILSTYNFSDAATVVDVGGGHAAFIGALLQLYPSLQGMLFDLPHAVQAAHEALLARGVADRCQLVTGDFFESVPPGGDVYILKSVIHNWGDEPAREILNNCRRAMTETGKLLLIERVIPADGAPSAGKIMDVVMMVNLGGQERSAGEYEALLRASRLQLARIIATRSEMSIIECRPA